MLGPRLVEAGLRGLEIDGEGVLGHAATIRLFEFPAEASHASTTCTKP
jgi:hypothetical protein